MLPATAAFRKVEVHGLVSSFHSKWQKVPSEKLGMSCHTLGKYKKTKGDIRYCMCLQLYMSWSTLGYLRPIESIPTSFEVDFSETKHATNFHTFASWLISFSQVVNLWQHTYWNELFLRNWRFDQKVTFSSFSGLKWPPFGEPNGDSKETGSCLE